MKNTTHILGAGLLLVFSAFTARSAHAGAYLSLAGATALSKDSGQVVSGVTQSLDGKLGFGGGVLLGNRFSPFWALETGSIFIMRKYSATVSATLPASLGGGEISVTDDVTISSLHIPVGPRIFLGRYLSVELGGYFDLVVSEGGGSDYGVQGGARLHLGSLFVEARYNQGIRDQGGLKAGDLLFAMVGFTFGGMGAK